MASSSIWWARKSCRLAIAPLAIRCKARLRSSGVAIIRAFFSSSFVIWVGDFLVEQQRPAVRAP